MTKHYFITSKEYFSLYMYIRFIYGKPDVPKASSRITFEVNTELEDLQRDGDWNAAVELAKKAGDQGVQSLATNDWYRLRRRLEILKVAFLKKFFLLVL